MNLTVSQEEYLKTIYILSKIRNKKEMFPTRKSRYKKRDFLFLK